MGIKPAAANLDNAAVFQYIEPNPKIRFGKPILRGTRATLVEVPMARLADFMVTQLPQLQRFFGEQMEFGLLVLRLPPAA